MPTIIRKYWPAWLIALVLFFFVVVLPIWSSDNFRFCMNHEGRYPIAENIQAPGVQAKEAKPTWTLASCLSGFTNQNGVGITALATVFLTVVTALLAYLAVLQINTVRRQLRAYVFPDQASLYDGSMLTPPQPANANKPGVIIIFKNSGQTPANQLISWAQIDVIEPRHEGTLIVPPLEKKFARALGAASTFPKPLWYSRALNTQEIADVGQGTKQIYLYGRTEYLDVYGEFHFTNFRYAYSGPFPNPAGMNFLTCENGNDFG